MTAKVFTAVPPSHTAKNPAMKKPKMPSFVSLSPPGSFSVLTLNTESAMRVLSPDARATTERLWREVAGETETHVSAAAVSAPVNTAGLWFAAAFEARARSATRTGPVTRPVVLQFKAWRETAVREDARDPTKGTAMSRIAR
mmetsp:Transcript_11727/g.43506  ORF Transcript_11727/g.43506 Transcript_11727/m.43506 type:complete len:142 (+) Transcript_11727:312-737(+)